MNQKRILLLTGALAVLMVAGGCSDVTQLGPDEMQEFQTLTVAYGSPGISPDPCNDVLPQVDGVAQDQEWDLATPLFVRMSGENGNGGEDYFLEIRAVWSDESKVGGADRIYFLVRYQDDDLDTNPDLLAYGDLAPTGEIIPSPAPDVSDPTSCDDIILQPTEWTRINADGFEDQLMMMLTEVGDRSAASGLIELNGEALSVLGVEAPASPVSVSNPNDVDVWLWRAGRTNLHPIPQYANWGPNDLDEQGVPDLTWSDFINNSGFAEDFWVSGNRLVKDEGTSPYVKNFLERDPAPDRINECPPKGRPDTEEELEARNRGLANDLALWWPTAVRFKCDNTEACSRLGSVNVWSTRLLPGDFDKVRGWGLRAPSGSSRDVRAKATYESTQEKGFPIRTLEVMREFSTGNSDDLPITIGTELRMVIGVFDASGRVGSGSTEIRLEFEAPKPRNPGEVDRC